MAGYVGLERFAGKAIQLQIPWHGLLLASWPEGVIEEEVWFYA